jgi:hypothetical protein
MSLTLDIDSTDRTDVLLSDTVTIDQDAASFISTCDFALQDTDANISISEGDEVHFYDGATDYFKGEVINIIYITLTTQERVIKIECQDLNAQLSYTTVDTKTSYDAQSDADIIDDLFDDYLATVDSETHVDIVQNPLTITIERGTLREALSQICSRTGAYFYIDFDNELHYFETESNDVGWDLSDEPDQSTSFSYFDDPVRREEGLTRLDGVYVIGANVSGWVGTHAAGDKTTVVKDNRITTSTGVTQRGQAILDACGNTKFIYEVGTYKAGLRAGMDVGFKCDLYDVDDTLTVRKLRLTFEEDESPRYELELGDPVNPSLVGQRVTIDNIGQGLGPVPAIRQPISSRGWSHNLTFSATDYNTVAWTSGTLTLADGTEYSIDAGNTGNMGAGEIHYVYLDIDASTTAFQTVADSPSTAVGENIILVAVCKPNADTDKDPQWQVFGGEGQGVFITADNIAAATITTDEIAANTIEAGNIEGNTITADEIAASAITATELAAGAVTATKLAVANADQFFTQSDGLILLGPHCPIDANSWTSLRGQEAEISGAFHTVAGPWAGTKALMVEEGTTNLCTNPSFETNANGWTNWNGSWTRTTDEARFGSYSYKCSGSPSRGEWMAFTLTAETTYTFSAWVKRIDGSPGIMLADYHTGPFVEWEDVVDVSSGTEWTRLQITFTVPTGEGGTYRLFLADKNTPGNAYYDGIQVEEGAQPTSYVDGSLPWGSWSGTAHASTSTRLATVVSLDTHAGLIDSNPQFSVVTNVRMPYDYNATWPAAYAVITEMRGSDASETITVGYDVSAQNIYLYVNGAQRATYSASFSAGDWLQIVSTFDYTNNEHNLYIDGVLQDTGTPVASANTKTTWRMGVSYSGGSDQAGLGFGQFAMLDSILTAEEVAALYQRGAPLVDTGAFDLPVTVTGDIYPADGSDITIHGDIGLNLDAPLGLMHGYKDFGGFLYWEGSVSGGGETTIIPDGSGDVEYGLSALYVATNRSGNTDRSLKLLETPSSGSNTSILYSGASDVYLTLYSTGKLTIDQTSGTETVYVNMLVIWQ